MPLFFSSKFDFFFIEVQKLYFFKVRKTGTFFIKGIFFLKKENGNVLGNGKSTLGNGNVFRKLEMVSGNRKWFQPLPGNRKWFCGNGKYFMEKENGF